MTERRPTNEAPPPERDEDAPPKDEEEPPDRDDDGDVEDDEDDDEAGEEDDSDDPIVRSLRSRNAKYRKRAQDAEARLKKLEDAGKTQQQKLAEERDTLRADNERLRTRVRRSNFIEQIGVSSPRLAWAALQDLSVDVEWDELDRASNLPELRKALKREFPEDFGDRSVNGGETGRAPADSDMNSQIRAAAGR